MTRGAIRKIAANSILLMGLLPIAGFRAGSESIRKISRELLEFVTTFDFLLVIATTLPVVDDMQQFERKLKNYKVRGLRDIESPQSLSF